MGGACSTYWRDEKFIQILAVIMKGRDYSGDIGLDGHLLLNLTLEKIGCECINCIPLVQVMVRFWALVYMIMVIGLYEREEFDS
jgi:hypothetical protein